jgi:hypothetical protein
MLSDSSVTITIPIRLANEANSREHWLKKSKRHSQQKFLTTAFLRSENMPRGPAWNISLTCISPRKYDNDNLIYNFKWIRDCISEYLLNETQAGRADSDPRLTWEYKQEKGDVKEHKIVIEISSSN